MGGDVGRTQERLNRHKEAGERKVLQSQARFYRVALYVPRRRTNNFSLFPCGDVVTTLFLRDLGGGFSEYAFASIWYCLPALPRQAQIHSRFRVVANSHCCCTKTPANSAQETGDSRGDQERGHGHSGCTWSYSGVGLVRTAL